jgi:hypothetical protein
MVLMFTVESYRDVLSESAQRGNIVASAWIMVAALAVALVLFV